MKANATRLLFLTTLLWAATALAGPPAEPGPWKVLKQLRLPTPPRTVTISEDNRQVFALCPEKRRRDSGGIGPGFIEVTVLRCYDATTGKQVFARDMSLLQTLMSLKSQRLAMSDTFDKVTVYDVNTWRPLAVLDTRSPNDSPPEMVKGLPPGLADFGGGGRLGDVELTADGKMLVTVRMETTGWKKNAKGTAYTSESFQRVAFWDVDKAAKVATLDCEDKLASNGGLALLPRRAQMLVKFDNGARLLDLNTRKWATIFPVKEVYFATVSPDEKVLAVTDRDQAVRLFNLDTGKELLSFKERPLNRQPRLDGSLTPNRLEFGPTVQFVDDGKCLRVTLNDGRTVLYRDSVTGAKVKRPASEVLKFTGGPVRVLAVSNNRRCAVTTSPQVSTLCTIWHREPAEKAKD